MQGNILKDGRKRVNLNGKKYLVHRLILLTFNPEDLNKEKCLVLHIDGNPRTPVFKSQKMTRK